jgi:hypothetical protein
MRFMNMQNKESLNDKNVLDLIRGVYRENYQDGNIQLIEKVLSDVRDLFEGKRKGFLRCDTKYHDIFHTLQVIHPFVGIIDGWNKSGNSPKIPKEMFNLGMIAVLLHDTGYIKTEGDIEGTGGKYTFVHIQRSAEFADYYLSPMGFARDKIASVKNIIMCTGVLADHEKIPFGSQEECLTGYALGTADLLGQMSADDYTEKLPALYHEFEEAYNYEGRERIREKGIVIFNSMNDLIRNTPYFYEVTVMERFKKMGSMYQYLAHHFKDSRNYFIDEIKDNIKKIRLADSGQPSGVSL